MTAFDTKGSEFEEIEFFRAIQESGARALLIGRRALVALGIPVLTAAYDFWLHIDDITRFNEAVEPMELFPRLCAPRRRNEGRPPAFTEDSKTPHRRGRASADSPRGA
jgi:hypothetical protein